jgi:hypothetical protein
MVAKGILVELPDVEVAFGKIAAASANARKRKNKTSKDII